MYRTVRRRALVLLPILHTPLPAFAWQPRQFKGPAVTGCSLFVNNSPSTYRLSLNLARDTKLPDHTSLRTKQCPQEVVSQPPACHNGNAYNDILRREEIPQNKDIPRSYDISLGQQWHKTATYHAPMTYHSGNNDIKQRHTTLTMTYCSGKDIP